MTTRELLIREINQAPEDVLQEILDYLHQELQRRGLPQQPDSVRTTGPYADYWNQYIGLFAGEEWERPEQGNLESREQW